MSPYDDLYDEMRRASAALLGGEDYGIDVLPELAGLLPSPVPPLMPERDAEPEDPTTIGARNSGFGICEPGAGFVEVVKGRLPQLQNLMTGLASVHVDVSDLIDRFDGVNPPKQRVILDVAWQTGRAGGGCQIDATRGCLFALGGIQSVFVRAGIFATDKGGTVAPGFSKKVEACVHWNGSINPKEVFMTSPRELLAPGVPTAPILIPKQARSLIVGTTVPASAGGLIARFFYSDVVGAGIVQRVDNPLANGSIICGGAEFLTLEAAVGMTVLPTWGLWL